MSKQASKYPFISTCWVWDIKGKKKAYRLGTKYNRMLYVLKKPFSKIYFRIEYGKAKNSKGHWEMFHNDYQGSDPKEALTTFRAFME